MTFGSDFVPAWMIFIFFLHRILTAFNERARRTLMLTCVVLLGTFAVNLIVKSALDAADHQTVLTDATLNRIYSEGQIKWHLLFFDSFVCGLCLLSSPLIYRIGAVILLASSLIAMGSVIPPSGFPIPYCLVALFIAFFGISVLLLFRPKLLYAEKAKA